MELKNWLMMIFVIWVVIVCSTIKYSTMTYHIMILILLLWTDYMLILFNIFYFALEFTSVFLKEAFWMLKFTLDYMDFCWTFLNVILTLILFLAWMYVFLFWMYSLMFMFMCDSFSMLYYSFPDSEVIMKDLMGFTTLEDFLDLYPLTSVNTYLFVFFAALMTYWTLMNFDPYYFDFMYMIWFESYLILISVYYNYYTNMIK